MAGALLAMEELHLTREKQAELAESGELTQKLHFDLNTRISVCYEKLLDFLAGECLTLLEKQDSVAIKMLVEFKTLVRVYGFVD